MRVVAVILNQEQFRVSEIHISCGTRHKLALLRQRWTNRETSCVAPLDDSLIVQHTTSVSGWGTEVGPLASRVRAAAGGKQPEEGWRVCGSALHTGAPLPAQHNFAAVPVCEAQVEVVSETRTWRRWLLPWWWPGCCCSRRWLLKYRSVSVCFLQKGYLPVRSPSGRMEWVRDSSNSERSWSHPRTAAA